MKRFLAAALVSCLIAGLASPAGSGVITEIKANTDAALTNLSASDGQTERAAEGSGSFDQAISDLYDNSMTATDEEVLASAEKMESDFAAVEEQMGTEAKALIEYLKYYEAAKSNYISGADGIGENSFSGDVISEWDRQGEYTSCVMSAADNVYTMVPRIKVNACDVSDGSAELDIYEWMTVGYAPDRSDEINAAAYGYTFSLKLDCDRDGNWQIASIEDTDANFNWKEEEIAYSLAFEQESQDPLRAVSQDGEQEMMAAVAAGSYTYNVEKAVAYADKYSLNYNSAYNSYKNKGGDCANFVSQCLYNGGFPQDSVWYKHSVAWINVVKQIAHFKQYGTFMTANDQNILKGNPIYFDWNGDGTFNHATICVGRNNSGKPILDSHTRDLYHATWDNWDFKRAGTIQLRGSGSASATSASFKTNAWGMWYEYGDGTYPTNCFKTIDGQTYYFNSRGYALKGLQKIGDSYYFFDTSSCVMKTGWVKLNGNWYYFESDGANCSGWEQINGIWYYFIPGTGVMATNFYSVNGKMHYFGENGAERFGWIYVSGKYYYLDQYGVVQYGWLTLNGIQYFLDPNGAMVTGLVSIDGVIYEFTATGRRIGKSQAVSAPVIIDTKKNTTTEQSETEQSTSVKTGWVKENNNWYYYANGNPLTGWKKINGKWYYFASGGEMKTGWVTTGGLWYYMKPNGEMKTGWLEIDGNWYYLMSEGEMKIGWLKLGSNWYYFSSDGTMRTGWSKIGSNWYYLQSGGAMKTGWLSLAGNWYYLQSNGVMVTGKRVIDGKTYYFGANGALK